ncbi:MAG: hypothetical protein LBO62_02145 [Endomicrobium sp.]|nr:hypothetical protein [Endomicrobium sp.]
MNNKRQMLKQVQHDRHGNDRLCTPSPSPKTDAKRHPELVSGSLSGSLSASFSVSLSASLSVSVICCFFAVDA